ncbi:hypothetical protein AAVH_08150 [Aphelenchoides avenae]|nr:hypothetical protein AAVH_08150 [Aphelenchus avenae]
MDALNGMQLEWVRVLTQNFGSYAKFIEFTRTQKPNGLFREHRLLKMEFEVLRQFLQNSDVLGAQTYLRVDSDTVALQFLHTWNFAEIVCATARNMGWATNKVHRLDELFVEASIEGFTSYYAADSRIRNTDALAKTTVQKCEKVFDLAKRLRSLRLSDAELAALFQLLLATFEPELFVSRDALLAYRNSIFRSLTAHHKLTLADSVVRCDLIVQFCADLQQAVQKQNDYFLLVESHRA